MSNLTGAELIAVERARQMVGLEAGGEGYSADHDSGHADELALAAAAYAIPESHGATREMFWPWDAHYWKPGDRERELVKAGALIAAAIDAMHEDNPGGGW